MTAVLLAIHILITITLVCTVLLQRSEGGALGIGGGGGGGGGLMSGRAAGNMLTKITAGLAAAFMVTSILLAITAGGGGDERRSIVDQLPSPVQSVPVAPAQPSAPIGE
jgi:preprotein translocase subunit SecG